MLLNAPDQVIRHAGIKRTVFVARHDVDVVISFVWHRINVILISKLSHTVATSLKL